MALRVIVPTHCAPPNSGSTAPVALQQRTRDFLQSLMPKLKQADEWFKLQKEPDFFQKSKPEQLEQLMAKVPD